MNHINVSVTIEFTPDEVMARLQRFLREQAPEAEMSLSLRAPFDIGPLNVGLTLQRDVTARITPLGDSNRAFAVAWQPVAPGPFPAFSGTIFVNKNEAQVDADSSIVTLDGHYHPPLGLAGDVFDAVVGRHIAQASASDLLDRISTSIGGNPVPAVAHDSAAVAPTSFTSPVTSFS